MTTDAPAQVCKECGTGISARSRIGMCTRCRSRVIARQLGGVPGDDKPKIKRKCRMCSYVFVVGKTRWICQTCFSNNSGVDPMRFGYSL